MRFLFSNYYWQTDKDEYMGKADYEQYGAVIRRYKNRKGKSDRAWFIDFDSAAQMVQWMGEYKYLNSAMVGFESAERFPVFNPFHECE